MFMVQADLSETQRERLASYLANRDIEIPQYTIEILRTAFVELFCAPKNSIADPTWRPSTASQQRSFIVDSHGECEGYPGYWVFDEENYEEGFVEEFGNTFWSYDEGTDCFQVRRNFKFRMRRPTK